MNGGVAIGIVTAIVVWWGRNDAWPVAAPLVLAWIASPAIARWTSLSPLVAGRLPVSGAEAPAFRLGARPARRVFEKVVSGEGHMLPPANFPGDPQPRAA